MGASLTLIAAAACTLLAVSSVVALRGWPSLGSSTAGPTLVVSASVNPSGHPAPASSAPLVVGAGASATRTVAGSAARTGSRHHSTSITTPAIVRPAQHGGSTPVVTSGSNTAAPASSTPHSSSSPSGVVGAVTNTAGSTAAGAVSGATHSVGAAAGKVSPSLGQTVGRSGSATGNTVAAAGSVAGSATGALPVHP